ncbi:lytic transglycosylase domain-containing protein [Streptomyces sp. NPDC059944]|uniref:lytic transglycosylase domain-containing protein n=1 Tax=unclassified Streptomyces TaxID=2593676 RepID=UPI00364C6B42
MSAPRLRRPSARTRQGLRTTAIAVAALAVLTASRAPEVAGGATKHRSTPAADQDGPAWTNPAAPEAGGSGDDSYHTELPPLVSPDLPASAPLPTVFRAQSGIPATVLRAYRAAETSVSRTDPGCRLPWQLLAAIGKVESGHAGGGAVTADGTTRGRIAGPALDGVGFALIRDSDGGSLDGDAVFDRAVGPMQFLPSTWRHWGADGNSDGASDPNNVFDAALAAGHYLCAGSRDLSRPGDLDAAVLGYNYSDAYLRTVRQWFAFYRTGAHTVPDGKGVVPRSPGAGGRTPATKPVGDDDSHGGGIVVGPDPSDSGSPTATRGPSHTPSPSPSGSETPDPSTTPTPPTDSPSPTPTDTGTPTDPGESTPPTECPTESTSPSPDPSTEPEPGPTCPSATPSPTESASQSATASTEAAPTH